MNGNNIKILTFKGGPGSGPRKGQSSKKKEQGSRKTEDVAWALFVENEQQHFITPEAMHEAFAKLTPEDHKRYINDRKAN